MDIEADNQAQRPISDDQELAKALAGITDAADAPDEPIVTTPAVAPAPEPVTPVMPDPIAEPVVSEASTSVVNSTTSTDSSELDGVKQQAIDELRPLVGKLNIAPEEKFDTYLLLIRSTDDRSLVAPAHEVATQISDEARRAQALLDIIKEIDYFANPQQ